MTPVNEKSDRQIADETFTERQAVLGQIGNVLHQKIELDRQLKTPFMTQLVDVMRRFHFYKIDPGTDFVKLKKWTPLIDPTEWSMLQDMWKVMHEATRSSKWADQLYTDDGETAGSAVQRRYAAMSHARRVWAKSDEPIDVIRGMLVPAITAMEFKPDDFVPGQQVPKRKNATPEEDIFRIAWRDLNQFRKPQGQNTRDIKKHLDYVAALKERYTLEEVHDYVDQALYDPENDDLRRGEWRLGIKNLANDLLDLIERDDLTADGFAEEMYTLIQRSNDRDEAGELPVEETDWTILPAGTLEELGEGDGSTHETSEDFVDPERMKWLARLALQYGNGAYIAVANLDSSGNYDYRVAVLPEEKQNGTVIEHAVAENPSSGNAIYVFRGERGLEDDGVTRWLTWRQVLSDNKSGARALGARRILHGLHTDDNVMEYLTRPSSDLDKPGYKR